ncbi:LysR family transcriptional regulator [Nannocystis punicea]|uniref:LysR family transcriptional regulator n=1 Tax=Nannocystis punicea TaxID=2995304 RepID=A0ABY7HBS6_9BACT|nr:LysR family transcriptional regulator [Nannocystis poenicansa]WAS96731.1 LysR family transcriptional regulator [Nannocystis poenicansa]
MDLNRAALFVRIVEAGGVTAAASRLKLPKSSVSRNLTRLERELGCELIVRGTRQFRLTDAGRTFFDAAARGVAALEEARDEIQSGRSELGGVVRVAAPSDLGVWLVAGTAARLARTHPKLRIELSLGRRQAEAVREGFDLAVCVGPLADSSLIRVPLGAMDSGLFASAAYLRERGTPHAPAELASHDCVSCRAEGSRERWVLAGPNGVATVRVSGRIGVDDRSAAAAAVLAGAGIGVLPLHLSRSVERADTLVRVLPDHVVRGEPVHILHAAARHVPRRVRLVCEAIREAALASCPAARARQRICS